MPRLRNKEEIPNSEGTAFEQKRMRGLRSRSRRTDPTIWIGKEGATEALLKQVENQLKSRELIKVKIQKSALSEIGATDFAEKVSASTASTIVEVMGHTFTLYKRRKIVEAKRKDLKIRSENKFPS
jgi:RNA-binding protein